MPPTVCVILVNWNGKADTLACLDSLAVDEYPAKRVLVVDNGSADGSADAVRRAHPWVEVIEAGRNLGFSGGNNVGLAHAADSGSTYTYFLNNDTTSEPYAIAALVEAAESPSVEVGLFTPVIHYDSPPREAWFAGSRLDMGRGVAVHDNARVPELSDPTREVPWASGCALLGRTDLLRSLGGFDDRFFLNWEDVDLCLRARRAGGRVYLVPAARVYHKVGRSFAGAGTAGWYYHVRNHLLLLAEHGSRRQKVAQAGVVSRAVREGLAELVRGGGVGKLTTAVQASVDHLVGRYGPRRAPGARPTGRRPARPPALPVGEA